MDYPGERWLRRTGQFVCNFGVKRSGKCWTLANARVSTQGPEDSDAYVICVDSIAGRILEIKHMRACPVVDQRRSITCRSGAVAIRGRLVVHPHQPEQTP